MHVKCQMQVMVINKKKMTCYFFLQLHFHKKFIYQTMHKIFVKTLLNKNYKASLEKVSTHYIQFKESSFFTSVQQQQLLIKWTKSHKRLCYATLLTQFFPLHKFNTLLTQRTISYFFYIKKNSYREQLFNVYYMLH